MSSDKLLQTAIVILAALMLMVFVPKSRLREAIVVFLFKLFLTWPLGLAVAEYGLIEYPIRLFSNATKVHFAFEFFIYPSLCAVFIMTYPEGRSRVRQLGHYFLFTTVMTLAEVGAERYTDSIIYLHWTWYYTWLSLFITFYASRKFYEWFFKVNLKEEGAG